MTFKDFRTAKGLTQEEMAHVCGLSKRHYVRVEKGQYYMPHESCIQLSLRFGISDREFWEIAIETKNS
jgi:DNA-binding XRE family transcriptional regulator